MSHAVFIRRTAERDVAAALQWYEAQESGLGASLHAELDRLVERLADNPHIYPEVYRGVRRAILGRFPLHVWYQVDAQRVLVLACTHGRMGPRRIAARLR